MRWHRNVWKEFDDMISAHAEIDPDHTWIDICYYEQQRKKAKCNRLLSCMEYFTKHVWEFKVILAGAPWNVDNVSFRHVVEDIDEVFEHMHQNSGASYLIKVWDVRKGAVRFIATKTLDHNEIRSTIIANFGLEDYEMELYRCYRRYRRYVRYQ